MADSFDLALNGRRLHDFEIIRNIFNMRFVEFQGYAACRRKCNLVFLYKEDIMTSRRGNGNTVVAFALGAFIGAGIALLLAPESGEKMRRDVRRFGKKALNKTQEIRTEVGRSIDNMADAVWDSLQEDFDRGREWTENTLADVQRALDAGKEFIRGEIGKIRGSQG
jgi:gas vesicle protein